MDKLSVLRPTSGLVSGDCGTRIAIDILGWILCINQSGIVEISHQVNLMKEIYSDCSHRIIWLREYFDFTDMPRPIQNTLPNWQLTVHEVSVAHQAGPHATEATVAEEEATKVFKLVEIFATGGHSTSNKNLWTTVNKRNFERLGGLRTSDGGNTFGLHRNQPYLHRLHLSLAPWTAVV
ncbi:hypothetical protein BKA56DRAFT_308349 [Ilyonectria sp. MPI-CAGE-AT-0026]|nr:hypothetical protein BKA56DRAFT_308349 [Ilyonectria sp. MPI-CAGE-AT-0026]